MRGERGESAAGAGEFYDRLKGAVYGAAIGDALGSAFEGLNSARIERELREAVARHYAYALPGSRLYPRNPGIPSDHTAMALALVNALLDPAPTHSSIALHLLRDLDPDGCFGPLFWNGKPAPSCVAMLAQFRCGITPAAGGDAVHDNTAATRAFPCGVFRDTSAVMQIAGVQASLSHRHPSAVAGAQAVALIVHDALYTATLPLALPHVIRDDRMRAAWVRSHAVAHTPAPLPNHLRDIESNGWDTVASAHTIAMLYANEPEMAIGVAAASGNDTGALASIVGAMAGAVNGLSALPRRWIEGLTVRDELERACEKLYSVSRRRT